MKLTGEGSTGTKSRRPLWAVGSAAALMLAAACGSGEEAPARETMTVVQTEAPTSPSATPTSPRSKDKIDTGDLRPIRGQVYRTEGPTGHLDGVNVYASPRPGGEKLLVDTYAEGAQLSVMCKLLGRTVPLREQSPILNMDSSNEWFLQQVPGNQPDRFVLAPYVNTFNVPVPDCPPQPQS